MGSRTQVVVYGCSLNMAGIAASLRGDADLEVHCVTPGSPDARQRLDEIDPAAIVFDLTNESLALDIALLRQRPGVRLIGVDASSDELLVLSCDTSTALSAADLIAVIRTRTNVAQ